MKAHNARLGDILRIALADGTHCFAVGDLVKVIEEEDHCELIRTERTSDGTRQWLSAGDYVNITTKPFRPLSPKTSTKRALKAVRDSIVALGWGTRETGTKDCPVCLLGHVAYVCEGDASDSVAYHPKSPLHARVLLTLGQELNPYVSDAHDACGPLWRLNDRQGQKEVMKLLDETIAKY